MKRGKVHINNEEWKYEISSGGVKIRHPSGKGSFFINMSLWTGWSWNDLERAKWKGSMSPAILPSEIKKYIENNLC